MIVLNLVIGLTGLLNVDNFAHVGGLLAGLWLAIVLPPGQVQTLGSVWQAQRGGRSRVQIVAVRVVAVVALIAVVGGVIGYGTSKWQGDPYYHYLYGSGTAPVARVITAQPPAPQLTGLTLDR